MDHYFIFICKDSSTPPDAFVPSEAVCCYIRNLLPDREGLRHLCTECLPIPLLQCNSAYLSVVNFYAKEELLEWKEVKERDSFKPAISEFLKTVDESLETGNISSKEQVLSSHINHLADQLPSSGTYKLDVIICYDVLKEFSVSSNIEFAGSLYRLVQWHGAQVVIATLGDVEESHLKEWLEITGATTLEDEVDPTMGALVWRGSLQIQPSNKLSNNVEELQLRLDYSENAVLLANPSTVALTDAEETHSEHLVLSSSLGIVDECNINTIPPYMVLPFAFRLSLCKSNDSSRLLEYLSKKSEAALIARMGYSITTDKPKADKSLSTNFWQKMIASGNIKFPEDSLPITESYVSFVITKSKKSGNIIAYPMSNPSKLDSQFYFTYVNESSSRPVLTNEENITNNVKVELPYLTESGFSALVNQINVLKVSMSKKCESFHPSDSQHVCLLSVVESAAKGCGVCPLFMGDNTSELLCEEIDPADWPERVHLLQKQIRLEKEKAAAHPILLQNLSPQRTQMNVCFTSGDAMKYFEPSGVAKDTTNAEIISSLYNVKNLTKQDHDKVLQTEWPEVMKCKYDDIYYNSNAHAEDLEFMCNGLVRLYVQHETSCCCNREQMCPDAPIPIRARHRESTQKWRSPSKMRTPKKEKPFLKNQLTAGQENSQFGRHGSISDLQSSRLMKKSGSFSSSIEKTAEVGRGRKQLVKPNPLPVRKSPRKTMPVKYSHSSTSRQPQPVEKKLSKSQKLPELSIKKLRVAVVQALEKSDINADHSFFRPCFKRLFTICQAFVQDLPCKKGRTSEHMQKIADANVKQVIEFEKLKDA